MATIDDQTQFEVPFCESADPRLHETIQRIGDFGKLPQNWNSYGANRIDPQVIDAAIQFLVHQVPRTVPMPSVVPTVAAGVQLEWHCNGADLEAKFRSPSLIEVWFEDLENGHQSEFSISNDFQSLIPLFERLSRKN